MDKTSICQSCGKVTKLLSCDSCYAIVCADCKYTRGCKICMGGRKLKAPADKNIVKFP